MNTFLGYLILAPLICCCFISLRGFQIEIVEVGSYILYFTTAQRINRLQQAGKKHGANMEHISLQFIMDYIYLHKLLVKAQQAHSGQMLSS